MALNVRLEIRNGQVTQVSADENQQAVESAFEVGGDAARRFREFGLGMNPKLPGLAYFAYGAGAVRLNIPDLRALKESARDMVASINKRLPDARIEGVLVQEMASGLEVIVGAVNDPYFGPTVAFGLGGILTELLHDITHRFAPFDPDTARGMIEEIKGAALLKGYRGKPALDVAALADALSRVSLLIADHADRIAEIDINPLFVREAGQGVSAADALIVLKQN